MTEINLLCHQCTDVSRNEFIDCNCIATASNKLPVSQMTSSCCLSPACLRDQEIVGATTALND